MKTTSILSVLLAPLVLVSCDAPQTSTKQAKDETAITSNALHAPQPTSATASDEIIFGTFNLPEISGAAMVDGRLLLVADDVVDENDPIKRYHMIALVKDPIDRIINEKDVLLTSEEQLYRSMLTKIKPEQASKKDWETVTDLEDAVVSPQGDVFLITSHSQSSKGKFPLKRQHLLRMRLDKETGKVTTVDLPFIKEKALVEKLPAELAKSTTLRPGLEDPVGVFNPGFNIEGLAWAPEGDLLLGLRSPTTPAPDSKAILLRLKNAGGVVDKPESLANLTIEERLNLGKRGIRGMSYDEERKGYWIIAGLSPDQDDISKSPKLENNWSLWFWDGKADPIVKLERSDLPMEMALNNPEAVCLVEDNMGGRTGTRLLLISDDKGGESRYALIPMSKLAK